MPSAAATRYNSGARDRMFALHGETVTLVDRGGVASDQEATVTVIWKRAEHLGRSTQGEGAIGYEGRAMCTIRNVDLPSDLGARSYITREGEDWEIDDTEPVDNWTTILHVMRPDLDDRMPGRL